MNKKEKENIEEEKWKQKKKKKFKREKIWKIIQKEEKIIRK